jgi:hypothetical protein
MARDHSQMSPGRAAASFPDQQSTERESFRRGLLMWLRLDRAFVRRDGGAGGLDTNNHVARKWKLGPVQGMGGRPEDAGAEAANALAKAFGIDLGSSACCPPKGHLGV